MDSGPGSCIPLPVMGSDASSGEHPTAHTSTGEWQSFESRMRRRRIERLLARARVAHEEGHEDEARAALDEIEELNGGPIAVSAEQQSPEIVFCQVADDDLTVFDTEVFDTGSGRIRPGAGRSHPRTTWRTCPSTPTFQAHPKHSARSGDRVRPHFSQRALFFSGLPGHVSRRRRQWRMSRLNRRLSLRRRQSAVAATRQPVCPADRRTSNDGARSRATRRDRRVRSCPR